MSKHLDAQTASSGTFSLLPYQRDKHGNLDAVEGCDRCACGSKYWENDECVDCGTSIAAVRHAENEAEALRKGFGYGALYLIASNA
jgi:hypothetical protein